MKVKLLKKVRKELRYCFDKDGTCQFVRRSDLSRMYMRISIACMLQTFYHTQRGIFFDWNWTAIANKYDEKLLDRQWRRK